MPWCFFYVIFSYIVAWDFFVLLLSIFFSRHTNSEDRDCANICQSDKDVLNINKNQLQAVLKNHGLGNTYGIFKVPLREGNMWKEEYAYVVDNLKLKHSLIMSSLDIN